MVILDKLAHRLDDLVEKGLISEEEARLEWMEAEMDVRQVAQEEAREGWYEYHG